MKYITPKMSAARATRPAATPPTTAPVLTPEEGVVVTVEVALAATKEFEAMVCDTVEVTESLEVDEALVVD